MIKVFGASKIVFSTAQMILFRHTFQVILAACAAPESSEAVIHVLCALTAFFEGFLFPIATMPSWISWLIYLNPLYWAFAGEMVVILGGQVCQKTPLYVQFPSPYMVHCLLFLVTLFWPATINLLILKTIGNRKGDCAWSCSRWQTQPEKICKSQRTNQCHSLRILYWFVLCSDFLRLCLSPRTTSRTISFSISNSF